MQRLQFSTLTSLPSSVSEETLVEKLHDHGAMIEQNPLVIHYERCQAPADAPPDEALRSWYELTDRIVYIPGLLQGKIRYRASFENTPQGLKTHTYAPLGVDIRTEWTVAGLPSGEPQDKQGLNLREGTDLRCPFGTGFFVRKNIEQSHCTLVARLAK
ncbi:uncharacterized protein N7511_003626 [Penicillium nucicola]|uniref:uncharacterized protein n=1 Tax=Penicillium nucicola TaxID=1850975 RepID=UPI0025459775|nr:uncharacterized protein N7511_003626 [Penicillium nucicola]KAJ5766010.1 hypothetical protein N7511_003626 [Penicillium nucicola]